MDRKYIDDRHVVARYLADQLPDDERAAFETYYLEHPDIVQELEAAARFKVGLAQLEDSGELLRLLQPQPWYRRQSALAAAAAIAALAIGSVLWVANRAPSLPVLVASATQLTDGAGGVLSISATYPIMRMRSNAADATIELPAAPHAIALTVLPEYEATPALYRIRLQRIADDDSVHEVASLGSLSPDANGFVPVYLNSAQLTRGRYQLLLSGETHTNAANDESAFLLQMVNQAR